MPQLHRSHSTCAAVLAVAVVSGGCDFADHPLPHAPMAQARVDHGQSLLTQYQCGSCHAIPAVEAARGDAGPPLAAFGRRSYIAGQIPNGHDALARWIVDPSALVPGTTMPSMGVSTEDARDMAAYLLSLE